MSDEKSMSLLEHLTELRQVLIVSLVATLIGAGLCFAFSDWIIDILIRPLKASGIEAEIVQIRPAEAFMANLKVSLMAGFILATPVIAYKIWSFILPALYSHERKYILTFVPFSVALFVGGILFAYFTVFSTAMAFLLGYGGIKPMISISEYLSFSTWFLLPFGLIFQLPIAVFFLAKAGVITHKTLAAKRQYAILIIFIAAAILTPTPDLVSQLMMAIPTYVLFELSILWIRFVKPRKGMEDADEAIAAEITDAAK